MLSTHFFGDLTNSDNVDEEPHWRHCDYVCISSIAIIDDGNKNVDSVPNYGGFIYSSGYSRFPFSFIEISILRSRLSISNYLEVTWSEFMHVVSKFSKKVR